MSKPDRDGITLLVLIILVALILFHYASPEKEEEATASIPATTTTPSTSTTSSSAGNPLPQKVRGEVPGGLTPFDPNSADSATLLSVGLRPWQVRNIMRYRARGGRYRQKEDFAQLYGLTLEQYRTLEPYIRIKPQVMAADVIKRPKRNYQPRSASTSRSVSSPSPRSASSKLSPGQTVDANTADTTELKRIPGLGSYFARRIISLRRQRQQFQSKEELLSIRNFPESALSYITLSHDYPPILINSMTQKELERHPLLNYLQARDIIRLRTNTGRINNLDDLSLLPSFTPQHLKKISSYIEY